MKSKWQYQTKSQIWLGKQLMMFVEKKSNKAKIKATSGEEIIIVWHNHFNNLLGNPSVIMGSAI